MEKEQGLTKSGREAKRRLMPNDARKETQSIEPGYCHAIVQIGELILVGDEGSTHGVKRKGLGRRRGLSGIWPAYLDNRYALQHSKSVNSMNEYK